MNTSSAQSVIKKMNDCLASTLPENGLSLLSGFPRPLGRAVTRGHLRLGPASRTPRRDMIEAGSQDTLVRERALSRSEDLAWAQAAAKGDAKAFSALCRKHYERALRIAFGILRDRHEAEDVTQEAFAKIYHKLGDFNGKSAFYTWLYRIVVNLSIDHVRKRKRRRLVSLESEGLDHAQEQSPHHAGAAWLSKSQETPFESLSQSELGVQLQAALQTLPEIHRSVLLLREIEQLSYEEIADILQVKKGTVMSRLFHARKRMAKTMQAHAEQARKASKATIAEEGIHP